MDPVEGVGVFHEKFDGKVSQCLGPECPSSCCSTLKTANFNSGEESYIVAITEEEFKFLSEKVDFFEIGVVIKEVRHGAEKFFLMSDCLDFENGCKLPIKPVPCKGFPFNLNEYELSEDDSVDSEYCPQWEKIAKDTDAVKAFLKIREAFGLKDHKPWLFRLNCQCLFADAKRKFENQ